MHSADGWLGTLTRTSCVWLASLIQICVTSRTIENLRYLTVFKIRVIWLRLGIGLSNLGLTVNVRARVRVG